ncbi:uncharacterized protein RAG0_11668 [Rhynchosporium agropyri]|uniref:Uncharacterized protein n=1 Tax=Rhynchosporium agropyri TaxID=914238 RepID=A0A1E1L596_9HELO|nr:uncharacterized protein RAG0_11668 [Rhynchosporium agropyri]
MYIQLSLLLVSLFLFALGFHITGKQSRFTEQIQWPRFEMKGTGPAYRIIETLGISFVINKIPYIGSNAQILAREA